MFVQLSGLLVLYPYLSVNEKQRNESTDNKDGFHNLTRDSHENP